MSSRNTKKLLEDFMTNVKLNNAEALQNNGLRTQKHLETFDALVLDAKLRQSLVTVRSLGSRGMRVAALEVATSLQKAKSVPTFSSRWCQRSGIVPSYEQNAEPFLAYLKQFVDTIGAKVLITSSDGTLAVLREHRAAFERKTRIAIANEAALSIAVNKDKTFEIAEQLGIGVPKGVTVVSVDEVAEAIRDIGLPAVVKPVESWLWGEQHGVRLISELVTTPDEARLAVENLTQFGGTVQFQQFLPGKREAMSFLYAHGTMYARFAQWAKRTQPPLGGTSVYRQSIDIPHDIGDQAERLVREIDLDGYSEVEFRRGSDGKAYLMEINPRLSASVEVAVRAGVDFPYLLYKRAHGERIENIVGYRPGGWMRYLEGDVITTMQTITQRGRPGVTPIPQAFLEFFTAFLVPTGYDYVDWRDPLPTLAAATEFAQRTQQRVGKGLARRTE